MTKRDLEFNVVNALFAAWLAITPICLWAYYELGIAAEMQRSDAYAAQIRRREREMRRDLRGLDAQSREAGRQIREIEDRLR